MNEVINAKNPKQSYMDSREVAEMIEKNHKELLRDIRRYSKQLNEAKIGLVEFWTENQYKDPKGEKRTCFLITKKGCEFIAHKLTGPKGTVFTARYINRFHEMEDALNKSINAMIPMVKVQSNTLLPRRPDWYVRNEEKITDICDKYGVKHKQLYHLLLSALGREYDLKAAREIYKKERGFYPGYAIDIVGYFPELSEKADKLLDDIVQESEIQEV